METPRVLVADDDPDMVAWIREVLLGVGAEVVEAITGADVLDVLVNRGRISIVVIDVHLPPPSGLRAVALARRAGYRGPFLLITAFPDPSLVRWSAEMGGPRCSPSRFRRSNCWTRSVLLADSTGLGNLHLRGQTTPWPARVGANCPAPRTGEEAGGASEVGAAAIEAHFRFGALRAQRLSGPRGASLPQPSR